MLVRQEFAKNSAEISLGVNGSITLLKIKNANYMIPHQVLVNSKEDLETQILD